MRALRLLRGSQKEQTLANREDDDDNPESSTIQVEDRAPLQQR